MESRMAIARNHHLFFNEPTYFHLISRCVRRAYLCGSDKHSGKCFDHRKRWLEKRLFRLAGLFFVDLYGYAILSNHYHLVLCTRPDKMQSASDREIARRWARLFPNRNISEMDRIETLCQDQNKMTRYRQRLCDISWLMRCLNENIARKANKEDDCTGRFWQGRFRSQLLLDEAAVFTCMAYVDLNPVRAGTARFPQQSKYTSLYYRVLHHCTDEMLRPLTNSDAELPLRLKDYLHLVNETASSLQSERKQVISGSLVAILKQLEIRNSGYIVSIKRLSKLFFRGIGSINQLEKLSDRLNLKWVKGHSASRRLFE